MVAVPAWIPLPVEVRGMRRAAFVWGGDVAAGDPVERQEGEPTKWWSKRYATLPSCVARLFSWMYMSGWLEYQTSSLE